MIGTMLARFLAVLLVLAPFALGETGEEGWLRYAPVSQAAAQQYKNVPRLVVARGPSTASQELARGLHSMLGLNMQVSAEAPPAGDVFVVGTSADLEKILPSWKPAAPIPAEGFSFTRFAANGRNYWVVAGGSDRGVLYGVFHGPAHG